MIICIQFFGLSALKHCKLLLAAEWKACLQN